MGRVNRYTSRNPLVKAMVDVFEKHFYRYSPSDLLDWHLDDVMADITGIRKDNPPPEEVMPVLRELGQLYGKAVHDSDPFADILGDLYMSISYASKQSIMGQYFTPENIAYMMTQITFNPDDVLKGDEMHALCEPSCGSGIMILMYCRTIFEQCGPEALERLSITAIDLDYLCAKMTAVQLMANALIHQVNYGEVMIYRGDALRPPPLSDHQVVLHASHAGHHPEVVDHGQRIIAIGEALKARENIQPTEDTAGAPANDLPAKKRTGS